MTILQLSDADFRDSILTLGFSPQQQEVLSKFYESKQRDVNENLNTKLNEPHYNDLKWRFEAQVWQLLLFNFILTWTMQSEADFMCQKY